MKDLSKKEKDDKTKSKKDKVVSALNNSIKRFEQNKDRL